MATGRAAVQRAVGGLKRLRRGVKGRLHLFDEPRLVPYRGHGTVEWACMSGRVLEHSGEERAEAEPHGRLGALARSLRRFGSDELPGARVQLRLGEAVVEAETDEEGYFQASLGTHRPLAPGWHDYEVRLLASPAGGAGLTARSQVLVPSPHTGFGIITDLDDTVVSTGARHRLRMASTVLLHDASTRVPFPGVGALYRALARGPEGVAVQPVFYLSRSAWNLYRLFERFLALHDLPVGPLFLEDVAVVEPSSRALGGRRLKPERIRGLLELYPRLPFVLLGDSGQEDPEVYRDVVRAFPGRVRAVYIRDVAPRPRDREVARLAEEVRALGVPMVLARDTPAIAEHAARAGLVRPDAVDDVRRACEADRG